MLRCSDLKVSFTYFKFKVLLSNWCCYSSCCYLLWLKMCNLFFSYLVSVEVVAVIINDISNIPALRRRGHSLTACNAAPPAKYNMAARGPQNGQQGLERCFLIGALLQWEKVTTEEKKGRGNKGKKEWGNNGHYVIAISRPPERWPLGCCTLVPMVYIFQECRP